MFFILPPPPANPPARVPFDPHGRRPCEPCCSPLSITASQDLRPPGPVPPDVVPFRRAELGYGRPPLCTFSLFSDADDGRSRGAEGWESPPKSNKDDGRSRRSGSYNADSDNNNDSNNKMHSSSSSDNRKNINTNDKIGRKVDGSDSDAENQAKKNGPGLIGGGTGAAGDGERGSRSNSEAAAAVDAVGSSSSSSSQRKTDDGSRNVNFARAFGHAAADLTPSATHVVNWIEDNPGVPWGFCRPFPGLHRTTATATATEGTVQKEAAASPFRFATSPAVLPDIVGAGGFAEFLPLLEAIIGR